jgi:thiamine kinase-like enzyme
MSMALVKARERFLQLVTVLLLLIHFDRCARAWQPESISSRHHHNVLLSLIRSVGWEPETVEVRHLDQEKSAFCNTVYRLTTSCENSDTTITIAKIFSPLALERMTHSVGAMDSYVAAQGLAPRILATSNDGLLMEFCESYSTDRSSRCMDERNDTLCAIALAKLHSLPPLVPVNSQIDENMLWRSCRILMMHVNESWLCRTSARSDGWTKEMLVTEMRLQQFLLSRKALVEVPIAHGDCKPSNLICQQERAFFIDLELCGRNYRSYDLAKLLRNDGDPTLMNSSSRRIRFLSAYAEQIDTDIDQLQFELNEILPLTWLEAAIFFAAMESVDPMNKDKWNSLAASRLRSYETC